MKQLWSAVVLLGVMVALLSWNSYHLTSAIKPLQDSLLQAGQAVKEQDWSQAEELTHQASRDWEDLVPYLYLVQSHRDVDEVSILLEEALEYIAAKNPHTYSALNARARGVMEEICRMEKFSVGNLM